MEEAPSKLVCGEEALAGETVEEVGVAPKSPVDLSPRFEVLVQFLDVFVYVPEGIPRNGLFVN